MANDGTNQGLTLKNCCLKLLTLNISWLCPCVSDQDEPDLGYEAVRYRRVFLDDEDLAVNPNEEDGGGADGGEEEACDGGADADRSDDNSYSDDHESYSSDSDHDVETTQQEAEWCHQTMS